MDIIRLKNKRKKAASPYVIAGTVYRKNGDTVEQAMAKMEEALKKATETIATQNTQIAELRQQIVDMGGVIEIPTYDIWTSLEENKQYDFGSDAAEFLDKVEKRGQGYIICHRFLPYGMSECTIKVSLSNMTYNYADNMFYRHVHFKAENGVGTHNVDFYFMQEKEYKRDLIRFTTHTF